MGVLGSNSRHIVQTLEGGVRRIRIDNARHRSVQKLERRDRPLQLLLVIFGC
jgi:hypothetical protein